LGISWVTFKVLKKRRFNKKDIKIYFVGLISILILIPTIMDLPIYLNGGIKESYNVIEVFGGRKSPITIFETDCGKLWAGPSSGSSRNRDLSYPCEIRYLPKLRMIISIKKFSLVEYNESDELIFVIVVAFVFFIITGFKAMTKIK
jgi:hypothetical protein